MAKKKKTPKVRNMNLEDTLKSLQDEYGEGSIREGLDGGGIVKCEYIPTGSISLDIALGGGIPKERITEIYGPEGCGKTTLALHVVACEQRKGGKAVYIDVEHAVDKEYANNLGVDLEKLIFSQPNSAEQAFTIIERLIDTGSIDIIVVDSVAALATQKEIDGEMDDNNIAETARFLSKSLKKLISPLRKSNTALLFINQLRHKIGVTFGSNETTPGGRALRYFASVRLDIRRTGFIKGKEGEDARGNAVRVKATKNKVAPPFREAEFEIIFGEGINGIGDLLDVSVEHDAVQRKGSHYYLDAQSIGAGRDNAIKYLKENSEVAEQLHLDLVKVFLPHLLEVNDNAEESNADQTISET